MIDLNGFNEESKELLIHVAKKYNYKAASSFLKKEFAQNGHRVVLLGAGGHTRFLLKYGGEELRVAIVSIVDEAKVGLVVEGMEVLSPQSLAEENYDFVIMSSDVNQLKMRQELRRLGIEDWKIVDIYSNNKIDAYLFSEEAYDFTKIQKIIDGIHLSQNPLVVISNSMTLTHLKLFKYLAKIFNLYVLTSSRNVQSLAIDTAQPSFRNFYLFDSVVDLLEVASRLQKGTILTINGVYWNALGACLLTVSKVKVFSLFVDILSSAHEDISILDKVCDAKMELFSEQLLWQQSQGVIFKDSLVMAQPNINRYKPRKYIQFYDYCDDDIVLVKEQSITRKLSFVYAGGLVSQKSKDHAYELHLSILDVANVLIEDGCSFDVFNAYDDGLDLGYKTYQEAVKSDLFVYHSAISPLALPQRLNKFDVGVVLFDFLQAGACYDMRYFKYGSFTKIMAYIEAGLPIIISKEAESMAAFVLDNEIGVALAWDELRLLPSLVDQEKLAFFRENVKKLKKKMSYGVQIRRLTDFLESE